MSATQGVETAPIVPTADTSAGTASKTRKRITLTALETTVKIVVAVAAAVISIATFSLQRSAAEFQRQSDESRRAAASAAAQEQRYLPLFRSIIEVDAALVDISTQFGWPKYTDAEADQENRLGTRLAYLADTLYFPKSDFDPGGATVSLQTAVDNAKGTANAKEIELHAADAVRLLSELMRIQPMLLRMAQQRGMTVRMTDDTLRFERRGEVADEIPIADRAVPAFKAWMPGAGMSAELLYRGVDLTSIADSIDSQLVAVTKDVLAERPELADRYVAIRNDVYRGRSELPR